MNTRSIIAITTSSLLLSLVVYNLVTRDGKPLINPIYKSKDIVCIFSGKKFEVSSVYNRWASYGYIVIDETGKEHNIKETQLRVCTNGN